MTATRRIKLREGLKTKPEKSNARWAMTVNDSASKVGSTTAEESIGSTALTANVVDAAEKVRDPCLGNTAAGATKP